MEILNAVAGQMAVIICHIAFPDESMMIRRQWEYGTNLSSFRQIGAEYIEKNTPFMRVNDLLPISYNVTENFTLELVNVSVAVSGYYKCGWLDAQGIDRGNETNVTFLNVTGELWVNKSCNELAKLFTVVGGNSLPDTILLFEFLPPKMLFSNLICW